MRKYIKENDFCGKLCQYAEQTINILKTEIDQLRAEKEALINGQESLQKYIAKLQEENKVKEATTITTIQITTIHKGVGETDLTPAETVEADIKDIIDKFFVCDDISVKHQIFIRDEVCK